MDRILFRISDSVYLWDLRFGGRAVDLFDSIENLRDE